MENQEAISVLESINAKTDYFLINDDARAEAIDMAISALEKQIPRKPIEAGALLFYKCPICKKFVNDYGRYCVVCGCKLDWSEGE